MKARERRGRFFNQRLALPIQLCSRRVLPVEVGNWSPPRSGVPSVWCGSQFLLALIPTRFFSAQVTPTFLCVLSLGRLISTSASIGVRQSRYSWRVPEWRSLVSAMSYDAPYSRPCPE